MLRPGSFLAALLVMTPIWPSHLQAASRENVAAPGAVSALQTADLRVATIAWRLVTGNAGRCPHQMPGTGLLLHALEQYSGSAREEAVRLAPFPSDVTVLAVVPGSPAALAGIRPGDGVEAVNGLSTAALQVSGNHSSARRDAAELMLAALPARAEITLTLRRGTRIEQANLSPAPACRTRLEVVGGNSVRARSDGSIIQIGEQFAASIDDQGLATVLAHELAHTILDHRRHLAAIETNGTARQRKALARQFEDEADLLSLDLLAGGGWDPAIAPRFLRRFAGQFDPLIGGRGVHRRAGDRAQRMEQELAKRPRHDG